MKKLTVLAIITALVLTLTLFAGCTKQPTELTLDNTTDLATGGVIVLSVNPKIAVEYDETGKVTGIIARNDDAMKIVSSCQGLIGLETKEAITKLVDAIGEAGYFVEDIEGNRKNITLEIESGSLLPNDTFIDDIINAVKAFVASHDWKNPIDFLGETDYGLPNYVDTDYGEFADGVTDFGVTDYGKTDYGVTDYGKTDYDATDYHTQSKTPETTQAATQPKTENPPADTTRGRTDYGVTDYGKTDYGLTVYNDTDYGPNNDGVTDYGRTDYGKTDYDSHTDYGKTDYGKSDYNDSDYGY